jgi:hypothetical protein
MTNADFYYECHRCKRHHGAKFDAPGEEEGVETVPGPKKFEWIFECRGGCVPTWPHSNTRRVDDYSTQG